ncbi:hypothetical protein V2J09_000360 [Rumex salicifolius]
MNYCAKIRMMRSFVTICTSAQSLGQAFESLPNMGSLGLLRDAEPRFNAASSYQDINPLHMAHMGFVSRPTWLSALHGCLRHWNEVVGLNIT